MGRHICRHLHYPYPPIWNADKIPPRLNAMPFHQSWPLTTGFYSEPVEFKPQPHMRLHPSLRLPNGLYFRATKLVSLWWHLPLHPIRKSIQYEAQSYVISPYYYYFSFKCKYSTQYRIFRTDGASRPHTIRKIGCVLSKPATRSWSTKKKTLRSVALPPFRHDLATVPILQPRLYLQHYYCRRIIHSNTNTHLSSLPLLHLPLWRHWWSLHTLSGCQATVCCT
jgi:hypothetical protein